MEESWYMTTRTSLWLCPSTWNVLHIMIFTLKEVIKWLGLSIFELWLHIVTIFVFSVLVAVKLEGGTMSWWTVFIPLFACDGCVAYFSAIVFIRLYLAGDRRLAATRTLWSACVVALLLTYKILLCQRLEGIRDIDYAVIHVPLFILLKMLAVRACQVDYWWYRREISEIIWLWSCVGLPGQITWSIEEEQKQIWQPLS